MEKPKLMVIDPPWLWSARSVKGEDRSPRYPRMSLELLKTLPISDALDKDAVVLLWVTDPLLHQAMEVVKSWNLTFKTVCFYWTKAKPSGKEHMGGGYYTRANPEQCWLLTKGKGLPRCSRAVRRWIHAPVRSHSEKPEEFFARVDKLFGDVPRLEMFARVARDGWISLGNEIDGADIFSALKPYVDDGGGNLNDSAASL
jgi:N6-adenosine-specific RNA methylase IME4